MSAAGSPAVPVPTVSAADLKRLLAEKAKGFAILDVRPRADFEKGRIPGSTHCPVHELSKRRSDLPSQSTTVVVVGEPGSRGRAGAVFLVLAGFGSVLLLEGGFPAWDGPVETGAPAV